MPSHVFFPFSYVPDLLDLGAAHDVRYLRIEIDSVHLFDPLDTFGYAIVGELVASAVPAMVALDGDYNADGTLDAADYIVWRANLDTNFDMPNDTTPGSVDPEDYDEWRANFGATTSGLGAGTIVPEPAAYTFFGLSLGVLLRHRRRR